MKSNTIKSEACVGSILDTGTQAINIAASLGVDQTATQFILETSLYMVFLQSTVTMFTDKPQQTPSYYSTCMMLCTPAA